MARLWLLVEWVYERNVFPSYGVVNVGSLIGNETKLDVGKIIMVREKHANNVRQARILKISDNKQQVKEQKLRVERDDHQVQNVLSLCMRTIRDMKSQQAMFGVGDTSELTVPGPSDAINLTHVVADTDHSTSDSDSETKYEYLAMDHRRRSNIKYSQQRKRIRRSSINSQHKYTGFVNGQQKNNSLKCSTPFSKDIKLTFDQATQTDIEFAYLPQIDQIEVLLLRLYRQFMSFANYVDVDEPLIVTPTQQPVPNIDISENKQNVEYADERIVEKFSVTSNINFNDSNINSSNIEMQTESKSLNPNALRVRRVSAHTTNEMELDNSCLSEMVPIGDGNAVVPIRLLNDIDWSSHSNATRQLLQAIFPRRILATHSLTGKQSPAFLNKPPKKRLDPKLVNDIVKTVSERCGVTRRLVRNIITIKCTDESKLYRNRQQFKHEHRLTTVQNQENVPPENSRSSDESSNVTASNMSYNTIVEM